MSINEGMHQNPRVELDISDLVTKKIPFLRLQKQLLFHLLFVALTFRVPNTKCICDMDLDRN